MKNVKILGAGLSGLSTAINLAKAGYNVDVFEKRSNCGGRFKGDREGLENWSSKVDILDELKSMNIRINFDCDPFKIMYLTDGNEKIRIVSKKPIFYLVKRGIDKKSLDQGLKNQAIENGVNIHYNSKKSLKNMNIISTGPLNKKINILAKGIIFETEMEDIAVTLVNKETSYNGYSYLLITKGYGCMCTVCFYNFDNMNNYFKKTYRAFDRLFDLEIKNQRNVGGVGSFRTKWKLKEDGRLFTGEAAGFQDSLWGFGMRYALSSGFLAAKSIIEGENYKKLIKKEISDRLKASILNRFYVEKLDDYGKFFMKQGKKLKGEEHINFLFNAYNLSSRRRILYPFARFSLSRKYKDF